MKNVNSLLLALALVITCTFILAQKQSDALQTEKNRLEKSISETKKLLQNTKANTKATFKEIQLLENQLKSRELLITNIDNQIRSAELKIDERSKEVDKLSERQRLLKAKFKKLLAYAYKHRNSYGKWMHVFSSNDFYEARRRMAYLEKLHNLQRTQFSMILQNKSILKTEIGEIKTEKEYKEKLGQEKILEKETLEKDQLVKQKSLALLKQDEGKLLEALKKEEKNREKLKQQIKSAIQKEIEAEQKAEAKRIAAEKALARKNKTKSKDKNKEPTVSEKETGASSVNSKDTKKEGVKGKNADFNVTKEVAAVGINFEQNRGRLSWPVERGSISEGYGKNAHPTLPNVYTNNNGIDISTQKNANVRCVFEGEVTTVFEIPGAGKVVIVKHGNYRTVYSNLLIVNVSVGDKIKTKQFIGSLMVQEGFSTVHFEIHQVTGGDVVKLNPSLWVAQ